MSILERLGATTLALFTVSSAVAQGGAMASLERLGSKLQSAEAWHASYQQEYVPAGMSGGELVAGTVEAAWPDRARFRTGDPVTQEMGLEDRLVRLVDLESGSCDEHLLDDDEWSRIPLAAVLDPAAAVEHFTVVSHGDPGFALIPHEVGGVQRVEVVLDADGLPAEVTIVDPQGAINRLRFTGWQPVTPSAAESWLPDPPPGVECVTDGP